MKSLALSALMLLQTLPAEPPPAAVTAAEPLTETHLADLRCAAVFAIVASEQERGALGADAYPPLGDRGREYFVAVGQRVMEEAGMTREAVRDRLYAIVEEFQEAAIANEDPMSYVDGVMTPCLAKLNAEVPPLPLPSLPECAAILAIAYEEVEAREGLSTTAKDLLTLASVLESRARDALKAEGLAQIEIDREMTLAREGLLAEGESPDVDYEHCFELAAP